MNEEFNWDQSVILLHKQHALSAEQENIMQQEKNKIDEEKLSLFRNALHNANSSLKKRRNQLVSSLFSQVESQLYDYTETETYQGKLIGRIGNYYESDNNAAFFVCPRDMYLADDIMREMPDIRLHALEQDNIGGFVVKLSNGSEKDCTFSTLLHEKQNKFTKIPAGNIQ